MLQRWIARLERFSDRAWYFPALGLLAGLDFFVVFIPTDPVLVSAVLVAPRRWVRAALCFTIGSTAGGVAFAAMIDRFGVSLIESIAPSMLQSSSWAHATDWIDHHGLWALFGWMSLPIVQQPPVAVIALGHVSLVGIALAILGGRAVKYTVIAWLASHAPEKLMRFKSIRKAMRKPEKPEGL